MFKQHVKVIFASDDPLKSLYIYLIFKEIDLNNIKID